MLVRNESIHRWLELTRGGRPSGEQIVILLVCLLPGAAHAAQVAPAASKAPVAAASPWKEIRPAEPKAAMKAEVQKMMRDEQITNEKTFDDYWTYVVSQLTWHANQPNYAKVRSSIKATLKNSEGPTHDRLAKRIVLPFCEKVAKGKEFSRVSRINALLTIGELCEVEPANDGSGAKSLPEARAVLLSFLDPKLPVDDMHDALRFAAMEGLLRHIERGGISDDKVRKLVESLMQGVLKATEPPAGRDAAVHQWMQGKAKNVLAGVNGSEVVRGG